MQATAIDALSHCGLAHGPDLEARGPGFTVKSGKHVNQPSCYVSNCCVTSYLLAFWNMISQHATVRSADTGMNSAMSCSRFLPEARPVVRRLVPGQPHSSSGHRQEVFACRESQRTLSHPVPGRSGQCKEGGDMFTPEPHDIWHPPDDASFAGHRVFGSMRPPGRPRDGLAQFNLSADSVTGAERSGGGRRSGRSRIRGHSPPAPGSYKKAIARTICS